MQLILALVTFATTEFATTNGDRSIELTQTVADYGVQMHPFWRLVMYFFTHMHNCLSPSNDYTAVACSKNNQAQLHTHVSVPYWSPNVWLGLELLRDVQFGLSAILNNSLATTIITRAIYAFTCRKWAWQPKHFRVRFARQWLNSPF